MPGALKVKTVFALLALSCCWQMATFGQTTDEDAQLMAAFAAEYETNKMLALEPAVLTAAHGRAEREGDTLTLKVAHSRAVALANENRGCEPAKFDYSKCYTFALVADLPSRHAFIVAEEYNEGGKIDLIDDRTGARTQLPDIPRFSPNNNLLLIISNDETSNAGLIQIWSRRGDQVTKEWETQESIDDYQTRFMGWSRNGIQLDMWKAQTREEPAHHHPALLAQERSGWRLVFQDTVSK